ncbi:MAG: RNA polymerase subunit sigma-70 [Stackebrandtia sp.]
MSPRIEDFEALRFRLTRYCYRLLGSAADADDAVQETVIRAFGNAERFDPDRAGLSTWVHRIATNICLDMLRSARRRAVAMDLAAEGPELGAPLSGDHFVEPMPGHRLLGDLDPAAVAVERETVRLAFITMLQRLAPRQRAVLVLRDVLSYSSRETADVLETTVAAVNSGLQRARATVREDPARRFEPVDDRHRELLRRYITAFENHDVDELTAVLREDAFTSMPPFAWSLRGGARIAELMAASDACEGDRLLVTDVNGHPGLGQYRPDADGVLRPFAVIAVEVRADRVAQTTTFLGTGHRFTEFGLPSTPN